MDKELQYHESHTFGNTIHQELGSLYVSELELFHVNCTNVGYYYCVEDSTESDANLQKLIENSQASKVYLFVEGSKFGSVPKLKQTLIIFKFGL